MRRAPTVAANAMTAGRSFRAMIVEELLVLVETGAGIVDEADAGDAGADDAEADVQPDQGVQGHQEAELCRRPSTLLRKAGSGIRVAAIHAGSIIAHRGVILTTAGQKAHVSARRAHQQVQQARSRTKLSFRANRSRSIATSLWRLLRHQ